MNKFETLKTIVDETNDLLGSDYTIKTVCDNIVKITAENRGDHFSGVLIRRLSSICEAFDWSFGIHLEPDGMNIMI